MKMIASNRSASLILIGVSLFLFSACGNSSNDEELRGKVETELRANPNYEKAEASVTKGVVVLTGYCDGENCDQEAVELVQKMKGVKSVDNQLQKSVTDLTLRSSVQSIISKYQGVQADVAAGNIVLRGSIEKSQVQPLMTELEALRPKQIDNQLAVKQ